MELTIDRFEDFFQAVNDGRRPFAWQRRLLEDHIAAPGGWPAAIDAPTGSGKSSVVEIHIFAVALMEAGADIRIPRRLSVVVDRRALVDNHFDRATVINERLLGAVRKPDDDILNVVARALLDHRAERIGMTLDTARHGQSPLDGLDPVVVAVLRGGVSPIDDWRDDPTACAVICATPDMWGSRLLLQGYGSRDLARPRDAGLLAYDSVVVVDEAHLARQLIETAGRIGSLEAMAGATEAGRTSMRFGAIQPLRVVSASATIDGDVEARTVGVEEADIEDATGPDEALARRLRSPKPVRLLPIPDWPGASSRKAATASIADAAGELLLCHGRTVACVLNTVQSALDMADELKRRGSSVAVLVGRMRPHDVLLLRAEHPGLLTVNEDVPTIDFLVATQTVEVGIDADFSAMITELAPGSAIAQRAGRVNRLGRAASTEVVVVVPDGDLALAKDAPPYRAVDLDLAREWLLRRSADPLGLAPWAVRADTPPEEQLRRMLLQRLEPWDALYLARTNDDLFAAPDLDLWLADDLDADRDVFFVFRQGIPMDSSEAIALLRETKPRERELYRVPKPMAETILGDRLSADRPTPYLIRNDEDAFAWQAGQRLRPGDLIVLDVATPCLRSGVVDEQGHEPSSDVLEDDVPGLATGRSDRGTEPFILRIGHGAPIDDHAGEGSTCLARDLLDDLAPLFADGDPDPLPRDEIAAILERVAAHHPAAAARLTKAAGVVRSDRWAEVRLVRSVDQSLAWLVIGESGRHRVDEELRQVWAPRGSGEVTLDAHQQAVGARAELLARHVGLPTSVISVLRDAGALHDEGKRDHRFQRMLRREVDLAAGDADDPVVLAKSRRRNPAAARAAWRRSGLPAKWRHEQLSAAIAWQRLADVDPGERALVARLVGTSHGYGHSSFPHVHGAVIDADGVADRASVDLLFRDGVWDELIETTHRQWGVWGCAYLEALLRAADCQVSGAGG